MESSEIIMNLWFIYDKQDSVIYGLAGRAYRMKGTDEEKTNFLKQLALTDYGLATRTAVPESFSVELNGEIVTGLCPLFEVNKMGTRLFDDLIARLQHEILVCNGVEGDDVNEAHEALRIPQNPLFLITALVEDGEGNFEAMMVEQG